jgi:sortase B
MDAKINSGAILGRPQKKAIIILACCLLLIAAGAFGYWQYQEHVRAVAAAEAAEAVRVAEEAAAIAAQRLRDVTVKAKQPMHAFARPAPPPLVPRAAMLDLIAFNPDTVGYILIGGTQVDYPVMQGTDNEYYLNHTPEHRNETRGSIFMDFNVAFDPETLPRHLLLHGHHMRDGSMFQNVVNYKTKQFFDEHPYIRFETLYLDTAWQVFSVYVCDSNEYVPMAFKDDEKYLAYLEKTAARSIFPVEVEFTADDIIMTLNTCSYEFSGAHTLVCAKLVESSYDIDWRSDAS